MSARGSIFLEEAAILSQDARPDRQYILRLSAPQIAARAIAGTFVHLTCSPEFPMRRPLSIMRSEPQAGWIELLYKPVGPGLEALTRRTAGESLSVLGPIGNGFSLEPGRSRVIGVGGGVGIPPMILLAEQVSALGEFDMTVLMGSEIEFPLPTEPSALPCPGVTSDATYGMCLLEAAHVPSRLASNAGFNGCHRGYVTDLLRQLLEAAPGELNNTQICACGPEPMLASTARIAREFSVPCQLALEEYMACGVGGCAGCTVLIQTAEGPAMKRVCVDGPVFSAESVYPAA